MRLFLQLLVIFYIIELYKAEKHKQIISTDIEEMERTKFNDVSSKKHYKMKDDNSIDITKRKLENAPESKKSRKKSKTNSDLVAINGNIKSTKNSKLNEVSSLTEEHNYHLNNDNNGKQFKKYKKQNYNNHKNNVEDDNEEDPSNDDTKIEKNTNRVNEKVKFKSRNNHEPKLIEDEDLQMKKTKGNNKKIRKIKQIGDKHDEDVNVNSSQESDESNESSEELENLYCDSSEEQCDFL